MAISQEAVDEVINLVLARLSAHRSSHNPNGSAASSSSPPRPFVLGLSGMQGSGKSTWARHLASDLRNRHSLTVLVLSLDDLYHTHASLQKLRDDNPSNTLYRNRGQPGTHDERLAQDFFSSLASFPSSTSPLRIPSYDKSAHSGQGDRVPESEWEEVPPPPPHVDILIFEGWCVGFRALPDEALERKWSDAKEQKTEGASKYNTNTLPTHPLSSLQTVNRNLARYNETFLGPPNFDYLVHLDTKELANVYRWRVQQEEALRKEKGRGMTDEEVIRFVEVYMPAYELYLEGLRESAFPAGGGEEGIKRQVRVLLDEGRGVEGINEL